jgi:hypothetical protein
MDDRHRLLQHLYGERPLSERLARRLDADPALRREYEAMRTAKAALDRRPPSTGPAPDAVARVLQAARPPSGPRPGDRPARRSRRRVAWRPLPVAAGLAVLLVAVWVSSLVPTGPAPAPPPAEPVAVSFSPAQPAAPDRPAANEPAVPAWDRGAEVVRLHRRLSLVRSRSTPAGWAPALPVGPSAPGPIGPAPSGSAPSGSAPSGSAPSAPPPGPSDPSASSR